MKKLAIVVVMALGCGSTGTSSSMRPDPVPAAVQRSAERLAAGAPIDKIERHHDGDDGFVYEVTWHVNGLEREARLDPKGVVEGVEEEVAAANVPEAVRATAVAKLGAEAAIKYVKMGGTEMWEVEARIDGKEREMYIESNGKELQGDDIDDDDDDDDDEHGD